MRILSLLWQGLQFVKRRRERIADEAERLHQRQIELLQLQLDTRSKELEIIFSALADRDKTNSEAVMEMAKGSQEMAKAFGSWLQMFHTTKSPEFSIVRDEDEIKLELERLKAAGYPVDLPEEFKLAWTLDKLDRDVA